MLKVELPVIRKAAIYSRATYWGRRPLHASREENEQTLVGLIGRHCEYEIFREGSSFKENASAMAILRSVDEGEFDAIVVPHIYSFGLAVKFDWETIFGLVVLRGIPIITPDIVYSTETLSDLNELRFQMEAMRLEHEMKFGSVWDRVQPTYTLDANPVHRGSLYDSRTARRSRKESGRRGKVKALLARQERKADPLV
ncbi:hypothetical protein [Edaphobacillus lindanitolerans]|uniref:Resolvase, N terminal domain n=1 Tax=Edaphobacillus lindanitolerans TaxID=550447 RepID=A0A1U7PRI5_9BACI|nr:hypothetical protein [Edaphobacillus lindanitolerans]SIT88288.1 hypothetical protein SAMN05428946_2252 [Edaphobacillus lindanitolerans]